MLVSAPFKRSSAKHYVDEHLEELARLADTAGAQVVGTLTQQLDRPHPGTYLGSGKVEELKLRIQELGATLVIFDDELTPAQGKNVEQVVRTRVMDRAELILDIFATRARSSEARMQVELAQLEYLLPRLTRMWTHLEKMRGGIGMRGPGETQLETDRRLIQHRIRILKERLADVERAREIQRQGRHTHFRVALVGYTNAGKSSILRHLANDRDVFVEDRLFATLDPLTREVEVGDGYTVLLTDTVGFIRKLPHHLVASFRATLAEAREADLLLHVIDSSHPAWEEQRDVVDGVLNDLGLSERPLTYVMNKMDAVPENEATAVRERVANLMPNSLFVSALAPGGLDSLKASLLSSLRTLRPVLEVQIPAANGRLIAEVHRDGEVLDQQVNDDLIVLRARLDERTIGRLRQAGARVKVVQGGSRPQPGSRDRVVPLP
ncbi:GTPase HflX [Gemmatimonas sp.]|uniref:GTPase HflX n=1 Tax=Gemmatimonas sp. TaxID=1962908 RepID=UPI0027BAFF37|nr:GTPase HflX [Gemmatimonas sp.]